MGKIKFAALSLALVLALAGCSTAEPAAEKTPTEAVVVITASSIQNIDDGITWARGLDDTVTADELSEGINRLGGLVPDLDIWFATNNEIGMALTGLNADVLADPANAGTKVDDLNIVIDDIEAAIEKGPTP